ncbi:MAG: Riboflavin transporter [Alphaproteobacteria bacterium MarineAlpha11_Bin1]|nr:MAG: Riboflavin transporter [Alphaproteobacteria bacterium MarineAlpha11_Bin1]|tara:strand:- start:835 stop:1731 length:897 start_codon:yes stop_codon:yes gene_type:complete
MADPAAQTSQPPQNAILAAFWILGTAASFILMMIAVRELSTNMSSFELLSFRSIIGIPVMCLVAWHFGFSKVKTRRVAMQVGRNLVHFGGQWCWVIGITLLPMAHVTALEFTMPMWTAIIAILFLGEPAKSHRLIAIIMGLAGVLVILRPGFEIVTQGALIVLLGALCYGTSNVMVKSLTRDDAPWVIVFWMQVIQLPFSFLPAVLWFDWVWPTLADTPWLLAMGLTGISAHFCLARALQLADATVCIPVDFVRLPLAALIGWLIYSEGVSIWVLAGAILIFGGNYYSVWQETREAKR